MPKATTTKQKDENSSVRKSATDRVPVTDSFDKHIFNAMVKYQKDFGLSTVQEVVRISVGRFLKQEGYIKTTGI